MGERLSCQISLSHATALCVLALNFALSQSSSFEQESVRIMGRILGCVSGGEGVGCRQQVCHFRLVVRGSSWRQEKASEGAIEGE